MAAAQVQTSGKVRSGSAASLSASLPGLPSPTNFILVKIWKYSGSDGPEFGTSECTDNQGNPTYHRAEYTRNITGGRAKAAIYYQYNIGTPSGTFTVTVDNTGQTWTGPTVMEISEWSGMPTTDPLDQVQHQETVTGTTDPDTSATAATTQASELVAAVLCINATQASLAVDVVSPAWTENVEELDWNTYMAGEGDTRLITSTGTQSCGWTAASSAQYAAVIATFKDVVAGGGGLSVNIQDPVIGGSVF